MNSFHTFLDYRIGDNDWIDAARCIAIALGSLLIAWNIRMFDRNWSRLDQSRAAFYTLFGTYVFLQEAEQIGQPMLVWRLPIILTLVILGMTTQRLRAYE